MVCVCVDARSVCVLYVYADMYHNIPCVWINCQPRIVMLCNLFICDEIEGGAIKSGESRECV